MLIYFPEDFISFDYLHNTTFDKKKKNKLHMSVKFMVFKKKLGKVN